MSTTKPEIKEWLEDGKKKGATHMIVVCDTFDHEDYPVYVLPGEDARQKYQDYNGPDMQRVMEVYSYAIDLDRQIAERRAYHFD